VLALGNFHVTRFAPRSQAPHGTRTEASKLEVERQLHAARAGSFDALAEAGKRGQNRRRGPFPLPFS
jgi:hypothetical protein